MKKLDIKQMQELLPDYVFGKLDEESKANFEANLSEFPEIQKEAEDAIKVFKRFEQMDVDALLSRKNVNMSVKVHKKIEARAKKPKFSMMKYYIPIAAAIALVFVLTNNKSVNINSIRDNANTHTIKEFVSVNDVNVIIDSTRSTAEITNTTEEIIAQVASAQIADVIPDGETAKELSDKLLATELSKINAEDMIISDNTNYDLLSGIEELNENQFQTFLKELKNEKSK